MSQTASISLLSATACPTHRIVYIDALRGFSMVCVVLMHFWNRFPIDIQHNIYFACVETFIQMFFLPLFFVVSGFFATKVLSLKQSLEKFRTWIVAALSFALLYTVFMEGATQEAVMESTLYQCYWFTIALFQMFVVSQLIIRIKRYVAWTLILVSILTLLSVFLIDRYLSEWFISDLLAWREACFYFPFYALGILCGRSKERCMVLLDKATFRNIIVITFVVLFIVRGYINIKGLDVLVTYICRIAATLTVISLFHASKQYFLTNRFIPSSLSYVGRHTLDIYFLHYFFLPSTVALTALMEGVRI